MTKQTLAILGIMTAVMFMKRLLLVCRNGSIRHPINQFPPL